MICVVPLYSYNVPMVCVNTLFFYGIIDVYFEENHKKDKIID